MFKVILIINIKLVSPKSQFTEQRWFHIINKNHKIINANSKVTISNKTTKLSLSNNRPQHSPVRQKVSTQIKVKFVLFFLPLILLRILTCTEMGPMILKSHTSPFCPHFYLPMTIPYSAFRVVIR